MSGGARSRLAGWGPVLAMVGLLLAGVALLGPTGRGGGPPLDPASARGLGTKALVETLRALGGDVAVTSRAPGPAVGGTALVLADDLDDATRRALVTWTRAGGTLVVADPSSPLVPWNREGGTQVGFLDASIDRRCAVPALRGVDRVSATGGAVFDAPTSGTTRCFPRNGGHWLVAERFGRGNLVALGGAGSFVNRHLGEANNAALLAALLVPRPRTPVAFLRPPPPGATGRQSLPELIDPRIKAALWQLAIAFGVVALWRGRRLGPPVLEPVPVELPGSELVIATGNLFHQGARRARAASLLRAGLRRSLDEVLGLPASMDDPSVAAAASMRTGGAVSADAVAGALRGPPPQTEAALVELARAVDDIRREVTRVPTP